MADSKKARPSKISAKANSRSASRASARGGSGARAQGKPKATVTKAKAPAARAKAPAAKARPASVNHSGGGKNLSGKGTKSAAGPTREEKNRLGKAYTVFEKKQRDRLLALRDAMLDSMSEVARDTLRSRAEGNEASAFGMHQADAGSDAYDRDFALHLLSQEQDALYEIDEALKRLEVGTYGVCELSQKKIPHERLEAMPFARYTVECQSELERQRRVSARARAPVHSLFAPAEEESAPEEADEETMSDRRGE